MARLNWHNAKDGYGRTTLAAQEPGVFYTIVALGHEDGYAVTMNGRVADQVATLAQAKKLAQHLHNGGDIYTVEPEEIEIEDEPELEEEIVEEDD